MTHLARVLVIDDDVAMQGCLRAALTPDYHVAIASTGEQGVSDFERLQPEVVLLDVMLPEMGGVAVLRALKRIRPEQPVIMMTAYAEIETAVQAIKLGAADYLQKPLDPGTVRREVAQAIERRSGNRDAIRSRVIGESAAMRRAWRQIERFGPTDIPILLQGETGTGKGLIAETLHRVSKRSQGVFVAIDCATIPEQLAESELFGYEDGAFTGAGRRKRGRVAFADRGTLFLDEIGTLVMATQAKLLTLVEQRNFLPLGARSVEPTRIDVRFVCATNVPLQAAVDQGTFRADLFHRLNGVTIELPPLRERDGDLELLAREFVAQHGRAHGRPGVDLTQDALEVMKRYSWPGNIRELQRVLSAAIVIADGAITPDDLPECIRRASAPRRDPLSPRVEIGEPQGIAAGSPLNLREIKEWAGREAQKRVIEELQKHTNISRQEMARLLGVDPKTLRSRLRDISTGR